MKNHIQNLEIKNFKSIKHLQLECKRVNIFIGEPNVGKSNILEALSLLGACAVPDSFKDFVRFEQVSNLFYDGVLENEIQVLTNQYNSKLSYDGEIFTLSIFDKNNQKIKNGDLYLEDESDNKIFEPEPNFYKRTYSSFFTKKYDFKKLIDFPSKSPNFLRPPFGDNLFTILDSKKDIQENAASFFEKYGLKLRFYTERNKNRLEIQKEVGNRVYVYPYSMIADTLQRIIFYLTAIESNKNSTLLFEEPEAHSFPPYVGMLADRIAQDEDNQYFIATHSPYLLSMIEKVAKEDLNVIITYFENYETKIKVLTQGEVREMIDYSIDAFYNLERFLDHEPSYES